jgi:dienelactone hydrolase
MVGEEGKIDDGCGKCGHYGPYYGNFHWYSTGYNPAGAEVWDTMRAIDFLIELKTPNGKPMVDARRIGMAGLSGGSARTFWSFAADERLKAAVACQGFTTVHRYESTIPSTCDVHLFYNYYQQPYGELYGVAAPRALRVVQATEDTLYNNPQPVADWMTALYRVLGTPDNFSYVAFPGRHGYTPQVIQAEHQWLAQWLKPETPKLPEVSEQQRRQFEANRNFLGDRNNLQCFTGSRTEGWKLEGEPVKAKSVQIQFTPKTPTYEINTRDEFNKLKTSLSAALREEVLPTAFDSPKVQLQLGGAKTAEGLQQEDGTLIIDSTLRHNSTLISAKSPSSRMIVLLTDDTIEESTAAARTLAASGFNVFILETSRLTDRHLRRHAALVGHTSTSLQVNDALAAYRALSQQRKSQAKTIYLMGKGNHAVPAIYAAAVEPGIAGVILGDCPNRHDGETALLGVLRFGDVPIFAGLLFPRPCVLTGEQGKGFEWTANLYKTLGSEASFHQVETNAESVIAELP